MVEMGIRGILFKFLALSNSSNELQRAPRIRSSTQNDIGPLGHPIFCRTKSMPRGKKKPSHNRTPLAPPSHKFCTYCRVHQVVRTFAKHQKACKRIWQMDHEARGVDRTIRNNTGQRNETPNLDEMVNISDLSPSTHVFTHAI